MSTETEAERFASALAAFRARQAAGGAKDDAGGREIPPPLPAPMVMTSDGYFVNSMALQREQRDARLEERLRRNLITREEYEREKGLIATARTDTDRSIAHMTAELRRIGAYPSSD